MSEPNIREYNFAVGGNIQRHIPGIPGEWPFGSIVTVNEDTNQVLGVSGLPESMTPAELTALDPTLRFVAPSVQTETPPALPVQSENMAPVQQAG